MCGFICTYFSVETYEDIFRLHYSSRRQIANFTLDKKFLLYFGICCFSLLGINTSINYLSLLVSVKNFLRVKQLTRLSINTVVCRWIISFPMPPEAKFQTCRQLGSPKIPASFLFILYFRKHYTVINNKKENSSRNLLFQCDYNYLKKSYAITVLSTINLMATSLSKSPLCAFDKLFSLRVGIFCTRFVSTCSQSRHIRHQNIWKQKLRTEIFWESRIYRKFTIKDRKAYMDEKKCNR